MVEPAGISLNTATVQAQWTLREAIEGCARHGIGAIAPWRDQLAACGERTAARMIADHGLAVSGLCRGGFFPAADEDGRRRAHDDNRRAVDEAVAIGAACLILVVGGLPPGSKDLSDARAQVLDGVANLLDHAGPAGMPLAIEPLHPMYAADRACINTLAHANRLCEKLGEGVGVAVDVYHVWWDPNLMDEIARAGKKRLFAFHISDWLVPTRDLLHDRGMMGDGVIDLNAIYQSMSDAGFDGFLEVEIFSARNWWRRGADEVLRTITDRCRRIF